MLFDLIVFKVVKDTVNIQIGDVNDNAPSFLNQPYAVQIPEVMYNNSLLKINLQWHSHPILLL